jgi:acyl-CoA thioesterase
MDGKFYGGTGIAVATAVMEAETGRQALWATAQFASSAEEGDHFDCQVDVVAEGKRSSQLQVTGSVEDRLVFSALGATGQAQPSALEVQFGTRPDVPAPVDCPLWQPRPFAGRRFERPGWLAITQAREANDSGAMWMRIADQPLTRPAIAFLADTVPSSVVRAAGRTGAGMSLDNSVRFGPDPDGDWVLVDVDPYLISGGYVHGGARLWSETGRLLGVASQTSTLLLFD